MRAGLPQSEHASLATQSGGHAVALGAPFTRLAEELELRETDVETALIRVRSFVERILTAAW